MTTSGSPRSIPTDIVLVDRLAELADAADAAAQTQKTAPRSGARHKRTRGAETSLRPVSALADDDHLLSRIDRRGAAVSASAQSKSATSRKSWRVSDCSPPGSCGASSGTPALGSAPRYTSGGIVPSSVQRSKGIGRLSPTCGSGLSMSPKCRCGAVELPVLPSNPSTWPVDTW